MESCSPTISVRPSTSLENHESAPRWLHLNIEGIQWQVRADWKESLLNAGGLRLEEWRSQGALAVVKQGSHRTVYRVDLPQGEVYLKHFTVNDLRSRLRQFFRGSKARIEWNHARGVAERGVITIEPLAVGETPSGESFFISRGVADSMPLDRLISEWMPELPLVRRNTLRRRLSQASAQLLAQMHENGVQHKDLHSGNILVQLDERDRPTLFLIDLHAVSFRNPLSWRESLISLEMFNRWCSRHTSRTDRRRFWQTYVRHRRSWRLTQSDEHLRAIQIEQRTLMASRRSWLKRDGVYLGINRHNYRYSIGNHRAWATRDLPSNDLRSIVANPEAIFERPGCRIIKHSPSSKVAELEIPINGVQRPVIFKRFKATKWSDPWVSLFRPDPALRSWINSHRLLYADLPAARPLAVVQRRRWGLVTDTYLLTEKVPHSHHLREYLRKIDNLSSRERQRILGPLSDQVARMIRTLHHWGFNHRDYKPSNLLVRTSASTAPCLSSLMLIDLTGLSLASKPLRGRCVRDLARFHARFVEDHWLTRTSKLRFLRAYLGWGLKGKADWKQWWREIDRETQVKVKRNQRHKRPLN